MAGPTGRQAERDAGDHNRMSLAAAHGDQSSSVISNPVAASRLLLDRHPKTTWSARTCTKATMGCPDRPAGRQGPGDLHRRPRGAARAQDLRAWLRRLQGQHRHRPGHRGLLARLENAGVDIKTKVQPAVAPGGRFTKDEFTVDLGGGTSNATPSNAPSTSSKPPRGGLNQHVGSEAPSVIHGTRPYGAESDVGYLPPRRRGWGSDSFGVEAPHRSARGSM